MGDGVDTHAADRRWFWGLLVLAVALRAAVFDPFATHHVDEIIQYLEQSHRLVFGYGAVPWETRYFIRSPLMSLLLAGPMALGEAIDPGGLGYLIAPRLAVVLVGLVPVIAAWRIGARHSRQHAIVGMAAMAVWVECVLFSVEILSETLAVSCFFGAAALLRREARAGTVVAAGALLAAAAHFRFQYGPAILVYVALTVRGDWRTWLRLAAGALPVVAASAAIDLSTGHWPYAWIANNYAMNIGAGRMKAIGGVSTWTYLWTIAGYWQVAVLLLPFLAIRAWRREPALLAAALVNLLVHQLIGHKEHRYLLLTIEIVVLVAAFGSVDLLRDRLFGRRLREPGGVGATIALVGGWMLVSAALGATPAFRLDWRDDGSRARLARAAIREPATCGLAVPGEDYASYGYSLLHVPKPVFLIPSAPQPERWWAGVSIGAPGRTAAGFNAMLAFDQMPRPQEPWARGRCAGQGDNRVCLYRRPGGCRIDAGNRDFLFQENLDRRDM